MTNRFAFWTAIVIASSSPSFARAQDCTDYITLINLNDAEERAFSEYIDYRDYKRNELEMYEYEKFSSCDNTSNANERDRCRQAYESALTQAGLEEERLLGMWQNALIAQGEGLSNPCPT